MKPACNIDERACLNWKVGGCVSCKDNPKYKVKTMSVNCTYDGVCGKEYEPYCAACSFNEDPATGILPPPLDECNLAPATASGVDKELADAHWSYIESLLATHNNSPEEIDVIGFHYKTAFIHGYKHAVEDLNVHTTE
jgi:hypothetical protein